MIMVTSLADQQVETACDEIARRCARYVIFPIPVALIASDRRDNRLCDGNAIFIVSR